MNHESQRYSKVGLHRGGNPPKRVLSNSSLRGKASYSPHADLHTTVELLAPHVPDAVAWYDLGLCLDKTDNPRHNIIVIELGNGQCSLWSQKQGGLCF